MVSELAVATPKKTRSTARPNSFKESEVGPIPDDWQVVPIGKLLKFKNGLNKAKRFFGYGTPIINYMDVFSHPGLREIHIAGLVDVSNKEIENFSARKGDVFFTRTSETLDEIGVASVLLEDIPDAVFSGFVLRGRPVDDSLADDFKKYCFASIPVRRQIVSKGTYTTRALTNGRVLSSVLIPLPPTKVEQQAIADALSDTDALIRSLEKLIEKKRLIKQGAMQELLSGRRRLPGFNGEWTIKALEEISEIRSGGTPSTTNPDFWEGEILWCTPTDITALGYGKYISNTMKKISESGLLKSSAELIPESSIIMTSRATIGECAINKTPVATNQGFKNLVPRSGIDSEFLYYLMQTQKERLLALCGGSTFLEIGKRQLAKLTVKLPKATVEQRAIGQTLADMDAELELLEGRLEKAGQIKHGMMQELLTGRVRLV